MMVTFIVSREIAMNEDHVKMDQIECQFAISSFSNEIVRCCACLSNAGCVITKKWKHTHYRNGNS